MLPKRTENESLAAYVNRLPEEERVAMGRTRKAAVQAMADNLFIRLRDTVREIAGSRNFGGVGDMAIPMDEILVPLDEYTDKLYKDPEEMLWASLGEFSVLINRQTGAYGIEAVIKLPPFAQTVDVQLIRR